METTRILEWVMFLLWIVSTLLAIRFEYKFLHEKSIKKQNKLHYDTMKDKYEELVSILKSNIKELQSEVEILKNKRT